MYRTVPRADATFSVKLEKASGLQGCADAGQTPSLQSLAGAVSSGEVPQYDSVRHVTVERRSCTYATGCVVTKQFPVRVPSFSYVAVKNGATFAVESKIVGTSATLSSSGTLSGSIAVLRDDRSSQLVFVPIRGTVGPTCMSIEESSLKIPVDNETYIEFLIRAQSPSSGGLPSNAHAPAGPLAVNPELETIPDEDVLSRFPRGATTITFPRAQALNQGVSVGEQRYCHPLTSCSAAEPVTERGQEHSACMRYATESGGLLNNALVIQGAKVSGRDGYALVTNRGLIPIEDGIGKVGTATLRVGETSIQLTYPARNVSLGNERRQEVSNTTCTFKFTWPEMQ